MKLAEPQHVTFVVERELPGEPAQAFRFWADPQLKARWSGCHTDWTVLEDRFDFRAGGSERKHWRTPGGDELIVQIHYLDIEPGARIVYAYEMSFGGRRLSASLVTIELLAIGVRTRAKVTEQAVFLTGDGVFDQRIQGTEEGYDRLVAMAEQDVAVVH